jgi:site-specific recombinase XerD
MSTLEPFTTWLEEQDRSPRTVRAYSIALRDFTTWFRQTTGQEIAPEHITPLDVKQYRQHLTAVRRLKPATVNNYLAGIRAYARWARQTGRAEHDPTNGIKSIRETTRAPRWLTRPEQYALLRTVKQRVQVGDLRAKGDPTRPSAIWPRRDLALVTLLLNTGLRLSEIAALHLDDIEISERSGSVQVRSGKGNKARSVPLNRDVRGALQQWLDARREIDPNQEHEHLFLSQKGGPLSTRAIGSRVSILAKKAGLEDVSPHTLRHCLGKNLVDAGVGLEKVATLLGHESLETTRLYTTPSEADLQEATERVTWGD